MLEKEYRENIARNIKGYRQKQRMSQKKIAEKLEMNYQNYSQMERGLYSPSLNKLMEICNALQLTPNDLLLDHQNNENEQKGGIFIKYEVRPVVCNYGIFENGRLVLILNSSLNAQLVKEILEIDYQRSVYQKICEEKEMKK